MQKEGQVLKCECHGEWEKQQRLAEEVREKERSGLIKNDKTQDVRVKELWKWVNCKYFQKACVRKGGLVLSLW